MGLIEEFSRSSHLYDKHAGLQFELGVELVSGLPLDFRPARVLDLGCGTGRVSEWVYKKLNPGRFLGVDASSCMIDQAEKRGFGAWRVADFSQDSFWDELGRFDLIFSNSVLHWIDDLEGLFRHVRDHLAVGGCFAFSIFGPKTMQEVSWALELDIPASHFLPLKEVMSMLENSGYEVKFKPKLIVSQYNTLLEFLRFVRGTGIRKERRLLLPSRIRRAERRLRRRFGEIRVSYEVGLFWAWADQKGEAQDGKDRTILGWKV